jgi:DNA repair protein RadC
MIPQAYTSVPVFSLKVVREKSVRYPYPKMTNALNAVSALRFYLKDKESEHLAVLMLDGQNNFIGMTTVAVGGLSGMQVQVRDVFKSAILHRAHAIVIGHNHPSGSVEPSGQDITFTQAAVEAGKILQCLVVDHIIISSGMQTERYYSFMQEGKL